MSFLGRKLIAEEESGFILRISLLQEGISPFMQDADSGILNQLEKELKEYEEGRRKAFTVPWRIDAGHKGSWAFEAMARIPYGCKVSYGELAAMGGKPRAIRAASSWCRKNPLPILLPCHRVIRKDGSLGRYSLGASLKIALLELESDHD